MTKRPTRVKLDKSTVKIRWDLKLGRMGKYPLAGDYSSSTRSVRVAHGMPASHQKGTLVHELMHAVWDKAELHEFYSETDEETIVSSISGWLFELIKDNPDLFDYLREE